MNFKMFVEGIRPWNVRLENINIYANFNIALFFSGKGNSRRTTITFN